MVGQSVTWNRFVPAEDKSEYAINRYGTESRRLYEVLNGQLESSKGERPALAVVPMGWSWSVQCAQAVS